MSSPPTNYTIGMSMSPPTDLPTYSRFMHQHTKRQMESATRSSGRRSPRNANPRDDGTSSLPNGVSSSSRSPTQERYQS